VLCIYLEGQYNMYDIARLRKMTENTEMIGCKIICNLISVGVSIGMCGIEVTSGRNTSSLILKDILLFL
jgi:hypothetical protein